MNEDSIAKVLADLISILWERENMNRDLKVPWDLMDRAFRLARPEDFT